MYWSTLFILPLSICEKIDKLFKSFLWNRGDVINGMACVAWRDVCKPKSQGGLGIKSVSLWNRALMSKHLWNIVNKKKSVWVKWIEIYRLKGKSIWNIKASKGMPWSWKKLLDLRDLVRNFVWMKIGNGKDCNIWFDKWHASGPLCNLIDTPSIVEAGMDLKAVVADMINENGWLWPIDWVGKFDCLDNVQVPTLVNDVNDKAIWVNKKGREVNFSVKEVWKAIYEDSPKVIWHKHVWFSQCIPRHAFILWTAIRGRLKTRDRISRWFTMVDKKCLLCSLQYESHSHLFFSCEVSRRLWERLKPMAKLDMIGHEWASVISNIVNRPANNSIWSVIQRLSFGAIVYFIWQERNIRRMQKSSRSEDVVFNCIVSTIRFKLLGLNIKHSKDAIIAVEMWNLPLGRNECYRRVVKELESHGVSAST